MSCEECEKAQDLALDKNIADSPPVAYVRIGNANVAVIGCPNHVKELISGLRFNRACVMKEIEFLWQNAAFLGNVEAVEILKELKERLGCEKRPSCTLSASQSEEEK